MIAFQRGTGSSHSCLCGTLNRERHAPNRAAGGRKRAHLNFTKTGVNTWNYSITITTADVSAAGAPVTVKSHSLTFNGSGQLVSPTGNVGGITISGLADGATPLTFAWNLFTAPTQRTLRLGVISSANVRAKPQLQ